MLVLGLAANHDANASIVRDGKLIAYANAERANRTKGSESYLDAMKSVLTSAGVTTSEIDLIILKDQLRH